MDTIREHTKDATAAFAEFMNPGKLAGLYLVFSGTAQSGQTPDFSNLGKLVIRRNDETLIERPMDVFKDYWNYRSGTVKLDSNTGGAFDAAVVIPFWIGGDSKNPGIENAYNLGADELEVDWTPDANQSTSFSALTVQIARIKTNWQENYLFRMLGNDENVTSGTSSQKFSTKRRNVAEIIVRDSGSVLSKAGVNEDDKPKFNEESKTYYQGLTIADSRIESQSFTPIIFSLFSKSEDPYVSRASVLNRNTEVVLTASGSDTIEITTVSIAPKKGVFLRSAGRNERAV